MALVRTDVSEERIACMIRVTRIGEPGTTLSVIMYIYILNAEVTEGRKARR
jgi:hypothetical protein